MLTVDFVLDGQDYTAINGGPQFTFDEAISLLINCADQDEVDYYWDEAHRRRRGEPVRLAQGQLRPVVAGRARRAWASSSATPTRRAAQRAMRAMLGMKKLDLAALQAAADGGLSPYSVTRCRPGDIE